MVAPYRQNDIRHRAESSLQPGELAWEERSGLLRFLSTVHHEVRRFNDDLGYDLRLEPSPPAYVDGSFAKARYVGFVITLNNILMLENAFCIYSMLAGRTLRCFIGLQSDRGITTTAELKPALDFSTPERTLYDWLRELLKASCRKQAGGG